MNAEIHNFPMVLQADYTLKLWVSPMVKQPDSKDEG